MNHSSRLLASGVLALLGISISSAAAAEENSRWYIGGALGLNSLADTDNTAADPGTPAAPGPVCGLLNPLLPLPQPLCNLLGGSDGVAGTNSAVSTSFSTGLALSGTVGYLWDDHWRPEVSFSYLNSEVDSVSANGVAVAGATGKATSLNVMANAWYDFLAPGNAWRPYAGIGIGFNNISEKNVGIAGGTFADGSDTVLAYQFGAGVSYKFSDRVSLSADYRYVTGQDASIPNPTSPSAGTSISYDDHAIYAGLRYALSKGKASSAADVKVICPISPVGVPADKLGPDGCPLDADGDGIPDYIDECPRTPAGSKVLPNGCALEGDCRTPRAGEEVDANGCAVDARFILRGVKFEFDSDRLLPESQLILNDVAETLTGYPKTRVQVEGHTDSIGEEAYNLGLSERRAIAVKTYLMGRGANGENMTPVGYGEAKPIADNNGEPGREENRRVEFAVVR